MSQPHRIVLIGFSSFEKVTFESFFRLAARRPPGYALVDDPSQADMAVVNADDNAVLAQCIAAKPCKHILLIGAQDGGTGWILQKRPLNLMKVLATVESILSPGSAPRIPSAATNKLTPSSSATTSAAANSGHAPLTAADPQLETTKPSQEGNSVISATARVMRSVRTGSGTAEFSNSRSEIISTLAPSTNVDGGTQNIDHILVVDDSDIALKFMRNRLSRFGFNVDMVNSGEEALSKLNANTFKFVFLDVMMEGLDGYQTCRAIKQRKYADGRPPVVVMLTSRGGTIDKIRGTLAGCDAYLTKPLNERDLIAILAKHDRSVARGFQETNFGLSTKSPSASKL